MVKTFSNFMLMFIALLCLFRCNSDEPNGHGTDDPTSSEPHWMTRASMPTPRQEIYPGLLENRIYVVGGFVNSGVMTDVAEVFDPPTNSWSSIADLPEARHHIGMVSSGGKMYGIGGFIVENSSWTVMEDVFVYDPSADTWSTAAPMPMPHAETVAAEYNGKIYVIGGRDADFRNSRHIQIYDPATDTWSTGELMPTARNSAAVAVLDSRIYVIGGRLTETGSIMNVSANEAYSPDTNTWEVLADMPQAQGGLAAAALNGKVYAFGGEYFSGTAGVYPECWEYDPGTDTWRATTSMLTPRHGTGAVTVADTIFVIGGADDPGFGAVATNEGFVVP